MKRTPPALKAPQAPSLRTLALAMGLTLLPCLGTEIAWAQKSSREPVTLNFVEADIEAVARTMATISGRNVVVDPRVKGAISLATDRPVSPAAALNQFGAALRLQGFTLVDTGGLYKIVPEADAKLQGNPVNAGSVNKLGSSNQIVTQIFNLNHESANNLVPVLRPLIGPNNTINVNPGTNSLVITDYADNLQRISQIISALDVAGASDVEVIPLQYAIASDLVPMVSRLLEQTATGPGVQGDSSYKTTLLAETRSNSVVMRAANPARMALVRSLVTKLDQPNSANATGNIHVVYLKNADAASLATTLRAAMAGESSGASSSSVATSTPATTAVRTGTSSTTTSTEASSSVAALAAPSTGGQIQADPATNSLIITAPEPQYRQLRAVIDKLDERRAQVYVESLIAEVNADKASEFGIQWQTPLGNYGDNVVGLLGTNYGTGGDNILTNLIPVAEGDTSSITAPSTGFNLGLAALSNGTYILGMLARALQSSGEGNVLSTPNLLTLDNQEAKIVVGQNVPFITGQYTTTSSDSSVNPFQTIERKDVGITLRVKPQISENGTIKMTIYQEVSAVLASSLTSTSGITTTQRTIETTVLVEDGGVVVLGGLIQDEFAGNQDKVPVLGDVPFLGSLFKSESRSRTKTNLMVFLRPTILRDANASNRLSLDRYDLMRGEQKNAQPEQSKVLKINDAPILPPQRAPVEDAVPSSMPAGD
jgi:general secretion pathway protein D